MTHRVAMLPGDGIGPEVLAEARKVLDALRLSIEWTEFGWGGQWYLEHGEAMPANGVEILKSYDAILHGAAGLPTALPNDVLAWSFGLRIRQELRLWANIRPAKLFDGVQSRVRLTPGASVDMIFLRENLEGEYSGAGGRIHRGHDEIGIDISIYTRRVCARIIRYAFTLANSRKRHLVSATKSSALRHGMKMWDEIVDEISLEFPDVLVESVLVDALCARVISRPDSLDIVVASNLMGDILTDVAGEVQGGIGMGASANVAPGADLPGFFEPIHGSAPDLAGRGVANPYGAIWSAALMLRSLGATQASDVIMDAMSRACIEGIQTVDMGGNAGTSDVGDAVARLVRQSVV